MVYLSLNLFKYILSFKDPRYERVRNGDPFGATPTRVWYTYKECNKAENPYKNVHMPDLPFEYHWGSPCIRRYGPEIQQHLDWSHRVKITILGKYFVTYGEHTEKVVFGGHLPLSDSDVSDSDDEIDYDIIKCNKKVAKMSLQCEACGPDLELYQRR